MRVRQLSVLFLLSSIFDIRRTKPGVEVEVHAKHVATIVIGATYRTQDHIASVSVSAPIDGVILAVDANVEAVSF